MRVFEKKQLKATVTDVKKFFTSFFQKKSKGIICILFLLYIYIGLKCFTLCELQPELCALAPIEKFQLNVCVLFKCIIKVLYYCHYVSIHLLYMYINKLYVFPRTITFYCKAEACATQNTCVHLIVVPFFIFREIYIVLEFFPFRSDQSTYV